MLLVLFNLFVKNHFLSQHSLLFLYYFVKYNPDVIVTTGANTAAAMCCFGKLFGKKVIFIETFANNSSPTKAGRIIYKFADYFIVQWESMLQYYPNAIYGGWIY